MKKEEAKKTSNTIKKEDKIISTTILILIFTSFFQNILIHTLKLPKILIQPLAQLGTKLTKPLLNLPLPTGTKGTLLFMILLISYLIILTKILSWTWNKTKNKITSSQT